MDFRNTSGWLLPQRAAPSPLLYQFVFGQAFSQLSCQKCRLPPRMKYVLVVLLFHAAFDGTRQVLMPVGPSCSAPLWLLGPASCTVELKLAFVVSFNCTSGMLFREVKSQVLSLIRGSI